MQCCDQSALDAPGERPAGAAQGRALAGRRGCAAAGGEEDSAEVLRPGRVVVFCKEQGMSSFMVPRIVLAQQEPLPTNSSGKVLKDAVRTRMLQMLGSGQGSQPLSRM